MALDPLARAVLGAASSGVLIASVLGRTPDREDASAVGAPVLALLLPIGLGRRP